MSSPATPVPIDLKKVKACTAEAETKTYVLDTNVLLHDPLAIHSFAEHKVIIPMTVLEELDHIKDRRDKDVSREARIAINAIDRLMANASTCDIKEGVRIRSHAESGSEEIYGTLAVYPDQVLTETGEAAFLRLTQDHDNDNRIINVALQLASENPGAFVCLVTKDINMRLKARGSGLEYVEDYRNDKVLDDIDLLATGVEKVPGRFWDQVLDVDTLQEARATYHIVDRAL
ncbi:MAG: PIN domain-containing protein, partial [Gammaproteobacteria bacterium]